jgi:hypothetical protein
MEVACRTILPIGIVNMGGTTLGGGLWALGTIPEYENEDDKLQDEPRDSFRNRPERNYKKNIANLVKMYTDKDKYGGNGNDNFNYKLIIFHDNCDTVSIPQSFWHRAYPRMLWGLA